MFWILVFTCRNKHQGRCQHKVAAIRNFIALFFVAGIIASPWLQTHMRDVTLGKDCELTDHTVHSQESCFIGVWEKIDPKREML